MVSFRSVVIVQGVSHYARYQIVPGAGEQSLDDAAANKAGPNYLMVLLARPSAYGVSFSRRTIQ